MSRWIFLFAFLAAAPPASASTLHVAHDHDPFGRCHGELTFTDEGIEFVSEKAEHSRSWSWIDIQSFDRRSDRAFSVLTWEGQFWKPGQDRSFDFTVAPGGDPLDEATFDRVRRALQGWVTDRLPRPLKAEYSVPVKHLHGLGGCQGTLHFGQEWIVFESEEAGESRTWRRGRDVESFWSPDPYRLEVHVFEENPESFGRNRRFRFLLKQRLDEDYYMRLRRETLHPR